MKKKTLMSWSSGKDSAWALYKLFQDEAIDVVGLFCTINEAFDRVAMHGVRRKLLQRQADSIGLPLEIIKLPYPCSNEAYEEIMASFVEESKKNGIECFAFGDLFLDDIRNYREEKLKPTGITPIFPLWNIPTDKLAEEMIKGGLKATITCIDPKQIPANFIGKEYNKLFLEKLPKTVDPCGENGEFHTFVYDAPIFNKTIDISLGERVNRDGFIFADVVTITQKALISWSGGKDSCYALQQTVKDQVQPVALVSVMNEDGTATKSNGVPREILLLQSKSLGLPLKCVSTNWKNYEQNLLQTLIDAKNKYNADCCTFGDIDIEEHRKFEEYISAKAGLTPILPLWGSERKKLAYKILESGIKAKISVLRKSIMPEELLGADYTEDIFSALECLNIDLLGENGEFHTLVYDSPLFKNKIDLVQDVVYEIKNCKLLTYKYSLKRKGTYYNQLED